jgi:hypothetical protein
VVCQGCWDCCAEKMSYDLKSILSNVFSKYCRPRIESVNILAVSGLPFGNEKTAEFAVMLTVLMENSFFNAEYGQQLLLLILTI